MTRLFAGTQFDIPPHCDDCGKPESECDCTPQQKAEAEKQRQKQAERLPPEKQTAKVRMETRKGKRTVTVIDGLTTKANDLTELLSHLQSVCGTGGTVKGAEDRIELQGNQIETVKNALRDRRYKVK